MTQIKTTRPSFRSTTPSKPVELLVLGAGWTSTFLLPLLDEREISHAATTRTGHDDTIPFDFDYASDDSEPYRRLPSARTILITFPLKGTGQSKKLTNMYSQTHEDVSTTCRWIQLGSTGIFAEKGWNDSSSAYDKPNARAIAEDELLDTIGRRACILNLAGLYGGERQPRNWVTRVAKTKEDVKGKGAVHLVHGQDVARAVIGAHEAFNEVGGKRWIITDLHTYDWWDLIHAWGKYARAKAISEGKEMEGEELHFERWVVELMAEEGVRALPRDTERLGRVLDGRGFWEAIGDAPREGRVS